MGVLSTILEHYSALVDPLQVRADPGDGGGFLLMPATYTRSVREVERLLRVMRDDRAHPLLVLGSEKVSLRACWWHINGWYIAVEHVLVKPAAVPRSRRRGPFRLQVDETGRPLRVHRVLRVPGARLEVAQLGVSWIASEWALSHEPMLPDELVAA